MRLLVLSDLHLEFAPLPGPFPPVDVVLLAGDIACPGAQAVAWAARTFAETPVLLVPGNHEFYDAEAQAARQAMQQAVAATPNVQVLDGRVLQLPQWPEARFVGTTLWTDFALRIDTEEGAVSDAERAIAAARRIMVDYRVIDVLDSDGNRRRLRAEDTLAWHHAQRAWLEQTLAQPFSGHTVVITHHGPHRRSLAPQWADDWASPAFISELPEPLLQQADLWVHGHTHTSFDYTVGRCRVVCNPRGYVSRRSGVPENPVFRADCVITL